MINVMLIDDHPMLNYGLASCLEGTGRFRISGQAKSLAEARRIVEKSKTLPALVILDILLGEENGLDFLPFLESFCGEKGKSKPPVLVCSVLEDPFRIRTALKMGASGYISKTSSKTELIRSIDTVLGGNVYLSKEHIEILEDSSSRHSRFTKRETDILNLVRQEKNNREIAGLLNISPRTVENHISNMYFKTGAKNRAKLMKL